MSDIKIDYSTLVNKPNKFKGLKQMGIKVIPVDIHGTVVPTDKYDPSNLEEMEETMNDKFDLEGPEEEGD